MSRTLECFHLSYNLLCEEALLSISEKMSFNWQGNGISFDYWASMFEENNTLESLDLSHNSLCERAALIVAENIRLNSTITYLNLNDNPLGPVGARLMFKLMDVLGEDRHLLFENCNFDAKSRFCTFDVVNPQGAYELDLASPYQRTIGMFLIRSAGSNLADQVKNVRYERRSHDILVYKNKTSDLPFWGKLEFTFSKYSKRGKLDEVVNARTFERLQKMACSEMAGDRKAVILGFSHSMHLGSHQLGMLIDDMQSGSAQRVHMLANLFSRIVDRAQFDEIEEKLSPIELAALKQQLGALYNFSDENPTGHYRLNLSNPFDHQLAHKILELNNDERQERKDKNLFDTSDDGQYMNFRNETIDGKAFVWNGAYKVPDVGLLEFDYVSTTRPPFDASSVSVNMFEKIIKDVSIMHKTWDKLEYLRPLSAKHYFITAHVSAASLCISCVLFLVSSVLFLD